ncbi:MAG: hypothetical protein B6242_15550 [Anaerolineaceae bacterium 4572_78]|nr:MAG: hypothetical protein B6242_15550 [Anaerolineaceae bacterium 4572_78]
MVQTIKNNLALYTAFITSFLISIGVNVISVLPHGTLIFGIVILAFFILLIFSLYFNHIEKILILIALFLPIESLPGAKEAGYKDIDLTTPLLILSLLYLGAIVLLSLKFKFKRTSLDIPILIFILAQVIIIISTPWKIDTIIRYIKYDKIFFLYYLMILFLNTPKKVFKISNIYIFSSILVALYGLSVFAIFILTGERLWGLGFSLGYLPRIYGTMQDQNIFAAYMIVPLLLLFSYQFISRNIIKQTLYRGCLVIIGMTILLTWSRSGLLGLTVAVSIYLILNRHIITKHILTFVIIIPILIGIVFSTTTAVGYSPTILIERFTGEAKGTDQSDILHYYMAKLSWETFLAHPLGVGRSNLLRYIQDTEVDTQSFFVGRRGMDINGEIDGEYKGMPTHSSWLEILVSEGIIGFMAFVGIVIITIRHGVWTVRRTHDPTMRLIASSFTAGFCGVLASAIFYTFDWMYFFWFIIAMIMAMSAITQQQLLESNHVEHA